MMFPKSIGVQDSNEAKMVAILEALHMFVDVYNVKLIVKSDSCNAFGWISVPFHSQWDQVFVFDDPCGVLPYFAYNQCVGGLSS